MKQVELQITGFTNLNNFFESLDESKVEYLDHYCDHREDNQDNNIYIVQYAIKD